MTESKQRVEFVVKSNEVLLSFSAQMHVQNMPFVCHLTNTGVF